MFLFAAMTTLAGYAQQAAVKPIVIELWPNGAPNDNGVTGPEASSDPSHVSNVSKPTLTVYPAATFSQFIKHDKMVIINKSSTYLDLSAMLTIHDSIGDVLDAAIPKRKKRSDAGKKRKKTTTARKTADKSKK